MNPGPASLVLYPATSTGSAVLTRAAMPAVCGEAIDVPDSTLNPLPDPTAAEKMLTPGAVTSGLSQLSPLRAPPELKLAIPRKPGFTMSNGVSVIVPPSAACSAGPLLDFTPRNGIVTS